MSALTTAPRLEARQRELSLEQLRAVAKAAGSLHLRMARALGDPFMAALLAQSAHAVGAPPALLEQGARGIARAWLVSGYAVHKLRAERAGRPPVHPRMWRARLP